MKINIKNFLCEIIILTMLLFTLTACTGGTDESKIKEKASSEIDFLESEIFKMALKYAKGEYNSEDGLDWESIYDESEILNESWSTVVLDLSKLNIPEEQINGLGQDVANLVISISAQNEDELFTNLYSIYSRLPEIEQIYSEDNISKSKRELKKIVFLAYVYAENENYEASKSEIQNASNRYNELMNDTNYIKDSRYNLNKILVEIEELRSAINLENIALIRIRFVNFIEEL